MAAVSTPRHPTPAGATPAGATPTRDFEPGSLVKARGREWVVLPGDDPNFLVVRPLGGDEEYVTGLFRDEATSVGFPPPDPAAAGDHRSISILATALRLGFTASAGPLRSLAAVAVTPRQYQLVPLLLALRQDPVRLLIGDDVGIGKTVEAALIAKELLVQGDATGLTVLCPPALAEQWRAELADKFAIEAELVLTSTVTGLERRAGGVSIFEHFPFTIVSTDFIKTDERRTLFARSCPDLVIVDEAHTCVPAAGSASSSAGQKRYDLLRGIADRPTKQGRPRHLLLVTATPHSGKQDAFRDLLSLLSPRLALLDLDTVRGRDELARHFVQRRRRDIRRYQGQDTPFPEDRQYRDVGYRMSVAYSGFHEEVLAFARETVTNPDGERTRRVRWWSALALLRSVASSPAAAAATFTARSVTAAAGSAAEADALGRPGTYDLIEAEAIDGLDVAPGALDDTLSAGARATLARLAGRAKELELAGKEHDAKLTTLIKEIKGLQADGYDPIVFCRYIPTAEYIGRQLTATFGKKATVETVTGELPHAARAARIERLTATPGRHILVATDCLSEGINLQESFQAVIHYDLAWNPTRHEQREGRVDRFGQRKSYVRAVTLYGADNGIDGLVLDVLLRKHRRIARDTGVTVPVPDNAESLLIAMLEGLVLRRRDGEQLILDLDVVRTDDEVTDEWHSAAKRESRTLTKYAHSGVDLDEVQGVLDDVREALGSQADVRRFVLNTLDELGVKVVPTETSDGLVADVTGLDPLYTDALRVSPGGAGRLVLHDDLPVPPGHRALVRTDPAVTGLARAVLEEALDDRTGVIAPVDDPGPAGAGAPADPAGGAVRRPPGARCGVFRTSAVATRTVVLLVRYRFHLTLPGAAKTVDTVAEDARLVGYRGRGENREWLTPPDIDRLFAVDPENALPEFVRRQAQRAITELADVAPELDAQGERLAEALREAHLRSREVAGLRRRRGLTVTPHDRADVLGVYVYLPAGAGL